jgi:hypothetical protein
MDSMNNDTQQSKEFDQQLAEKLIAMLEQQLDQLESDQQ